MERALAQPNMARAVRRSRAARAAIQRRKRRFIASACAAALIGSGTFLSLVGVSGSDVAAAAVHQAQSLSQLLDQRSPGERTAGAQTKHKKVQHALARPHMRAKPHGPSTNELAKILMPSGPVGTEASLVPPAPLPAPQLADFVTPPAAPGGGGGPVVVAPGGGSPGGGVGGGGSPGGPPIVYQPQEIKPPVAAVPEPGTWAMMLLGFGLMGWRVRRRKARPLSRA